jgi:hypothetical protein
MHRLACSAAGQDAAGSVGMEPCARCHNSDPPESRHRRQGLAMAGLGCAKEGEFRQK